VANDSFDGRAAAQFALMIPKTPRFWTGDEGAVRVGRVAAAEALLDIGALDHAAG
jgi:hypothetical protein